MIRYLRLALLAMLALVLLVVAMANRATVTVKALPDDIAALLGYGGSMDLPLYAVIFGGMIAGVLIGFVWEWMREHRHRAIASTKTREVSRLERELATMRDATSVPQDDVLALLDKPKAR